MAVQKRVLLLDSILLSLFVNQYAPAYSVCHSFYWTATALFSAQVLLHAIWSIIIYPKLLSPLRHLPTPPGASLILGHFLTVSKAATGEPQREWIETVPNDGIIKYSFLFNDDRVLLTSPKALAEVLVHRNYEFIKPSRMRTGLGRVLGIGILLAEGDEHKRQRRTLMPAFSFRHVKDLYPIFWDKSREMVEAMDEAVRKPDIPGEKPSSVVEIGNWASRATLDIIGVAGLGQDFHALADPNNELNQTYRSIFTNTPLARAMQLLGNFVPLWILRALPLKRNQEISDAIKLIKSTCRNLVQSKKQKLEKGERTDVDILSVAIESGGFSDEDLVNQLMTFLAAGHETTASALIWATYLMCLHPEVQSRLRQEIRGALPSISDRNAKISSTDIDHLPYLNAVCNETMRVFSPVPITLREAAEDTTILDHPIPKGTTIIICPWAINSSKTLWGEDAKEFNPDRWMGPGRANTGGADSNYSFLTFLHGPRSCIGKDFAKAEFASLVAAVVGRFEMELEDPNMILDISGGITAKPRGGLFVKIKPIEGW
ncbi:cytochrome P450 [Lepidopterella palustris CBS 459.81]|uniref:Cytochrome P450 n=1 Tax=Lepidopterella palustris CBS 459.81 TaxID=1314670 RepID=A0A8E2JBQ5_9PEZI|nr:cytochrome P450 [Lepidopterella palustris CBS 459.81]